MLSSPLFVCFLGFFFLFLFFFFFNDTATTEIYTLSLHDALPICAYAQTYTKDGTTHLNQTWARSEEHTSELQSPKDLVCRLLLEKKKQIEKADLNSSKKSHNKSQGTREADR